MEDINTLKSILRQISKTLQKASDSICECLAWTVHAEKTIGVSKENAIEKAEKHLLKTKAFLAEINRLSK